MNHIQIWKNIKQLIFSCMGSKRKIGHIEKILKEADKTIDEGIRKADEILD